jgi:hypothetical protein
MKIKLTSVYVDDQEKALVFPWAICSRHIGSGWTLRFDSGCNKKTACCSSTGTVLNE